MQKQTATEVNPIEGRANGKCVRVANRNFYIGGITKEKVTNDIFEFNLRADNKIEWRPLKFKNNVLKPRNSFSACGSKDKIYIWGGLETSSQSQQGLSELIEIDVQNSEMRLLPLKDNIAIHSSSMMYDDVDNCLRAIGGTDQQSKLESYYYTLDLNQTDKLGYKWKKQRLASQCHQGYLWQNTSHLTQQSLFNGKPGKFLTVVGGCRQPHSPFNSIVEFDLQQMKQTQHIALKWGLVAHDSLVNQRNQLLIFGGSNGGDFSNQTIVIREGEIEYKEGHQAIGCSCIQFPNCYAVIGGINGHTGMNGVVIYDKTI